MLNKKFVYFKINKVADILSVDEYPLAFFFLNKVAKVTQKLRIECIWKSLLPSGPSDNMDKKKW